MCDQYSLSAQIVGGTSSVKEAASQRLSDSDRSSASDEKPDGERHPAGCWWNPPVDAGRLTSRRWRYSGFRADRPRDKLETRPEIRHRKTSLSQEGGQMFVSLNTADQPGSSLTDIGICAEPLDELADELQISRSQVCLQGRTYEITVQIRSLPSPSAGLLAIRGGRRIPVMTAALSEPRPESGTSALHSPPQIS